MTVSLFQQTHPIEAALLCEILGEPREDIATWGMCWGVHPPDSMCCKIHVYEDDTGAFVFNSMHTLGIKRCSLSELLKAAHAAKSILDNGPERTKR